MRSTRENGQAIVLVVMAMGILVIGAMGLAIDASQLFAHQQMAQAAADAAAQAGMMSVFQGVNKISTNPHKFTTEAFTCGANDARTPCQYAALHGFGGDTVKVSFPTCSAPSCSYAATLSDEDTPNQTQVTITRKVQNTLIRMLGAGPTTAITVTGIAAVVKVLAPVPLLILHPSKPSNPASWTPLAMEGGSKIKICGGPSQSIQVNSTAKTYDNGGSIDLSKAGPANCSPSTPGYPNCGCVGTGSDFGSFGPPPLSDPSGYSTINFGSTGHYLQPSSPIPDPLLDVLPPKRADVIATYGLNPPIEDLGIPPAGTKPYGCQDPQNGGSFKGCELYSPGVYTNGINVTNKVAIFKPGIYYMDKNGFQTGANGNMQMCTSVFCTNDSVTADGMLVYNNAGTFNVGANGNVGLTVYNSTGLAVPKNAMPCGSSCEDIAPLKGTPESSIYKGILFFENRDTDIAMTHILGGGGYLDLIGTVYATNKAAFVGTPGNEDKFQTIEYHGNPGSATMFLGMIITDALAIKGNKAILQMLLEPQSYLRIRQIALVGGGPHL